MLTTLTKSLMSALPGGMSSLVVVRPADRQAAGTPDKHNSPDNHTPPP